ncbi:ethylmalonyl-CoA decarboxylase-like [Harmonia axyridis]|uniref:ethylmalonyl-CoA decarboxylase-like n=1 Tax=Harmonia axyridis TaxID=115357 RepID=UPI001E2789D4|nr:ethylmalonyl-CoA decarboxylase-like [Harmonia axyridis]XP_045472110.1 ethylmalonyl-CoA decarboxylase-like [Harmonia axyridis]XP_045472111.1 ethylmalonyl-CoA decarboxylase-like [Harmonia axyridis]
MNDSNFDSQKVKNHLLGFPGGEITIDWNYANEGIAIIWLNHVEKRNSITGKMMVDLSNCIDKLETWTEGKAVIICGKGVNFCSGGDLDFVKENANPTKAFNMSSWMISTLSRLGDLEMVTVCVAHGPTLGGGAEISTFCDYMLVTENVKFGFIQGCLNIITAWGGGTRLIQKLGERRALTLFLTSKILSAEECVSFGLAEKVISAQNFLEDALDWLKEYVKHNHQVIRSFKSLVNTSRGLDHETLKRERQLTSELWGATGHIAKINEFSRNKKSNSSK